MFKKLKPSGKNSPAVLGAKHAFSAPNASAGDLDRARRGSYVDGASCSTSSFCASGLCRGTYPGGNCCGPKGKSTGCTDCDYDGDCSACASGYTKTNYECFPAAAKTSDGGSCSASSSCSSGTCRGGNCCNSKGRSAGCTDCDSDGDCATCSSGYTSTLFECFPVAVSGQ